MDEQFNKCPQCKSTNIEDTDYDDPEIMEGDPEVQCIDCEWEGYTDALVAE